MSTFRVLVIPADVSQAIREEKAEIGSDRVADQLHFLQGLVGGYVERVRTRRLMTAIAPLVQGRVTEYRHPALLVDEEGLLKNKAYNERASVFYGGAFDALAGDAVLFWETEEDWLSLPDSITPENLGEVIAKMR